MIEVSISTLSGDREQKGRVYACVGAPEYWLLSLFERLFEVYRDPGLINGEYGYRSLTLFSADDSVSPLAATDTVFGVGELLP